MSLIINVNLAEAYLQKDDLKAAFESCQRAIELDPNWYFVRQVLALVYLKQGRTGEALAEAEKSVELSKRQSYPLGVLGYIYAQTGNRKKAVAVLEELTEKYAKQQAKGYDVDKVYVSLADKDQVFAWVEKDFQSRSMAMPTELPTSPLGSLRDEPRFKDLAKRMGMPEIK